MSQYDIERNSSVVFCISFNNGYCYYLFTHW